MDSKKMAQNIADNINANESSAKEEKQRINEEMYDFFKDFIMQGKVYKEKELAPGFYVKLRALSAKEIMEAESIVINMTDNIIVADIGVRIRTCSILSFAIEVLGDKDIYTPEELAGVTKTAKQSADFKRAALYDNLIKLPPQLLEKMYNLYLEAVKEQNALYADPNKIEEQSENFSKHPSEE